MATSRPFTYNTGSFILGTTQSGSITVGYPTNGFGSTGLQWWNGPDEDLGYVVANPKPLNNQPTPDGKSASVGFWRSSDLTDNSFISLVQSISKTQSFASTTTAKTWLANNGYWTSYLLSSTLSNSLFAVYKAESNTNDSLGLYNGTPQGGLTYSSGKSGNAFLFNGTNAYVSLPSNLMNFTGDFSISLWFYCLTTSNQMTLINCHDYNGTIQCGWVLNVKGSTNQMIFEVYQNGVGTSVSRYAITFNTSTYNGQLVNVVLTRKVSTQTKIYINSVEQSGSYLNGLSTDNPTYYTPNNCEIGADLRTGDGLQNICVNGIKIDEVYVWTKELVQSEATELYNIGTGKFYPFG